MGSKRDFLNAIRQCRRLAVDTSCCIYYLEKDPLRWGLVEPLIDRAATGSLLVELCAIVKMELLILPYRSRNVRDIYLVKQFVHDSRGVSVTPLSEGVMELATEVRATTGLKVPDALIVGSALLGGCDAIVGNDRRFGHLNDREDQRLMSIGGGQRAIPSYLHLDDYLDQD